MGRCDVVLADCAAIRLGAGPFDAKAALAAHRRELAWLAGELEACEGKKVVVTHHGVHPSLVHERFQGSDINGGFVSDLSALLPMADVFIGGHVHNSFDHMVGSTRLVVNPRGYPLQRWTPQTRSQARWENAEFDPRKVIEI